MTTALATNGVSNGLAQADKPSSALAAVRDTLEALKAVRTFLAEEFKEGLDFGVIPGTGTKPTLLLPGAQKAMMYCNVAPQRTIDRVELGAGHLEVMVTTRLISRSTGQIVGEGTGSCSSMEKKYRYRKSDRKCPKCGGAYIKVSKYGDRGFYCHDKAGGCGAQFRPDDEAIAGQAVGQSDNPDIHDCRNTILKMAIKRADVSAAMSLACLSERFTQDLEDTYDLAVHAEVVPQPQPEPPAARPTQTPPPAPAPMAAKPPPPKPPAPPAAIKPAPTPAPGSERVPTTGRTLWRWAAEIERQRGPGLMHYLEDLGKSLHWGTKLIAWNTAQVDDAFAQAQEAMELIYNPDSDESGDGGDDGRYDDGGH